jgi:hypothetical protein
LIAEDGKTQSSDFQSQEKTGVQVLENKQLTILLPFLSYLGLQSGWCPPTLGKGTSSLGHSNANLFRKLPYRQTQK